MNRSTAALLLGSILGVPILLLEHPMAEMGAVLFYVEFAAMAAAFASGIALWVIDRK